MIELEKSYRDKNVMVTGGLGFIGSTLAIRLADLGARVLVVDSLIDDYGGNLFNLHGYEDRIRINIADVRTASTMNYLVRGQHYIFNLAGQVSHLDSMEDPYTDLEINCRSQLSILESCRKFNPDLKIVFAATRQQYGKPQYLPVDERHLMMPTDVNGINKIAGEMYHLLYNNVYGIRACSLRLTNTYGPRMLLKHNRQGFVGVFIRQAMNGEEIRIFGDGQQRRDFNYVDDVVEAFLLAGADDRANGQAFNLGGTEVFKHLDFVKILLEVAGSGSYRLVPFPENKKKIDIGDYYGNYEKFRALTGWEPKVRLREGLEKTIAYFRQHKKHYWPKEK
ncbi:MAG: NAD-dependent epimerase/dehydratase family protein [candidate division KSB1 bacterium]|nr:NAD-dependent epimerase/dehydratase family protein [candidate division KSB1 bacterium]MDZ7366483.1 NAD-dependent epimerase/dehydratase family protein [candidate division KSB1 bacterium]MDZ7404555.1 NAD-dependent epimerase/dehydratase family protein [candidate division KSB1 bacterium]